MHPCTLSHVPRKDVVLVGNFMDASAINIAKKQLDATERTNALLTELLAETKVSNDLTKRLILIQNAYLQGSKRPDVT